MKSLQPFEPIWEIRFGGVTRQGKGTLPKKLFPPRDAIDEMRVFCGGFTLAVRPKEGTILADSAVAHKAKGPAKLIWCRVNQFQIGTHDSNSSMSPDCLYYGLGLECDGVKVGYQIRSDGVAKWGKID